MSGRMTDPETIRARKRHRCSWCWQRVDIGATYQRYRVFSYGGAQTIRMHPECFGAMQEAADDEGGWIEWIPGQERPVTGDQPEEGTK